MTANPTATEPTLLSLPAPDEWPHWMGARGDAQLAEARRLVDDLKAQRPSEARQVLRVWNDAQTALSNAASIASLFSEVHPDRDVRERAENLMQDVQKLDTDLGLDTELFAVFADLDDTDLDADASRVLEHTLRDFRRSGVDRDEATRARLRELSEQAILLSQEFSKNIREDVRSIRVRPEQLAGMPQDWVEAHPVDEEGLVTVTTDYPDVIPFRTFAHDADARRELVTQFLTIAWPANDAVLQKLFAVRREHASLLGYATWADYDAEVKMIGAGQAIGEFIDRITALSGERAERDKAVLLERLQQDRPDATDIDGADATYYAELVRKEQHAVDAQRVRTYFPFEAVRQGLLDVTGRLFGLEWTPVSQEAAGTWHADVATYDVARDGERIGRIHLDLHPRDGKYKHAAQFDLVRGVRGVQLPEGVLVCNFNRGLMEHDEVVTLFHEFGHLVHHVVGGDQEWVRFSGVATEWDFVEAPSQMLEEWAWDADVLATFARNEAGETIPADLVAAMREADDFGKGYDARTQMFYAALSYDFHVHETPDLTERLRELMGRYSVFPYIAGTHMQCHFGHLDGYSSAYYTYMWSLVIAKDMFSAFDRNDLFDPEVARAYRDKVLAQGGRRDAADLVADFLGRPYTFDAYAAWLAE
ncbi:peptidase M3 [Intrasporangium chromatireducens Q5-1]|uniref:Peptidase M3 n=1 Tax=Intrasporangium chromatireducens Q5-1 TaxID=584657 RepID=W9GGI6_9MICO|nr:M3 family metallopeptidase [Intrasporangium chromatireducens]EWT05351.1 peptidase M3 [Intrasporangium chromatireducens Q5-1]